MSRQILVIFGKILLSYCSIKLEVSAMTRSANTQFMSLSVTTMFSAVMQASNVCWLEEVAESSAIAELSSGVLSEVSILSSVLALGQFMSASIRQAYTVITILCLTSLMSSGSA